MTHLLGKKNLGAAENVRSGSPWSRVLSTGLLFLLFPSEVCERVKPGQYVVLKSLVLLLDPLAIVVAVFGVCWAPFHIERLLWSSISQWTDLMHNIYQYVHIVSGVFFYLSSAVNPIIYSLLSTRFRECFRELVCSQVEDNSSVRDSPPYPKISLNRSVSGSRAPTEGKDSHAFIPLLSLKTNLNMDTAILTIACKETACDTSE